MGFATQILGYLCGIPLELLAINAILRSEYRNYLLIFVYAIADFLTTVLEMPNNIAYYRGDHHALDSFQFYYWLDETIMQFLSYSIVISLIYHASANLRSRRMVRIVVIGGALLFTAGSFLVHHDPSVRRGLWMTPWARDLNFCAAVLDLALWALLLSARKRDYRLLMLSGAFGIQFTGEAIGAALRSMGGNPQSRLMVDIGNLATVISYLVFLYVLWQSFRPLNRKDMKTVSSV